MASPAAKKTRASRTRDRVRKILRNLETAHPDAKLDLAFSTPLELLVALILAAQARDDLVNQVTGNLFSRYRSAEDYAATPLSELQSEIRRVNFYRNKARSIQNCCRELAGRFGGKVPDKLADLLTLPGVGRKTANIVLGNAFGQPAIGVDTHVMRLSQRLGLTRRSDPDKIEADLVAVVPEKQRVRFCHLLQYHGRRICFARKPRCPECTINTLCPYPDKTKA
jgi:endonuclease III